MARSRPPPETGDLFARAAPQPLSVGELTRALRAAIEPRFRDVWVAGEVGNLRRQSSGHFYFTLKDAEAVLPCALWATQARRVRFDLAEGQEVVARGFVEIYPPHGKYQLIVQEVEPRGAGAQALLLAQIKERLERDGLLDPERKRPLPFLPTRIGVATSPTGAALRDFLRVVRTRYPNARVLIAPCRVQGEGAAATVIAAVRALVARGVDVVVVTRGGGSAEDLSAFNDERLARALATCPVPVVSAVGHEVDISVCDLVADVRAATPTHAAQLVVPVREELLGALAMLRGRLERSADAAVGDRRKELRALRAELGDPGHPLSRERHRLDDLLHRAEAWLATLPRERLRLERLGARLAPANVARILERGFALVLREGRVLARSTDAGVGDELRIALGRGWLDARVSSRDAGSDPLPAGARDDSAAAGVDPSGRATVLNRDGGDS